MQPHDIDAVGLYVHVPFCRQLCPYCDFAVAVRRDPPHDAYCDALLRELDARSNELDAAPTTVYFGGGTPAMWATSALERFLERIDGTAAVEITIEANPHDITQARLETWARLGIDRVSLGVQSFDDGALRGLGRDHDAATARRAVELLVTSAKFRSSIDLIYGGPRYGRDVLASDLDIVAVLRPDHISAYELTVEPTTVFGRRQRSGDLDLPQVDDVVDCGVELVAQLAQLGYERYEVSSFGRDGDRAIHNSGYWLGRPYVGLGVGAHSMTRCTDGVVGRRQNTRRLGEYLEAPTRPVEIEEVGAADHLAERLLLAGRTTLGVRWDRLRADFAGLDGSVWRRLSEATDELQNCGWLEADREMVRPTPAGLDVADAIAERFWDATRLAKRPG